MGRTVPHESAPGNAGSLVLDPPAKDPVAKDEPLVALPGPPTDTGLVQVIERLAANPDVDVTKLERIIELQERILRHEAEAAFNVAFAAMQPQIPTIVERAATDKTTYAPLEDIIEPIRPILSQHGFTLGFQTEWPADKQVKVIGILTHRGGHSRKSEFLSGADQTGSKNAIQALGSTVSYGKRYTTKDLLCIVTRKEDDDGGRANKGEQPDALEGYDAWLANLEGVADGGMRAFSDAWNKSPEAFRKYLARTAPDLMRSIKAKAAKKASVA